jgi:hypothetical protein
MAPRMPTRPQMKRVLLTGNVWDRQVHCDQQARRARYKVVDSDYGGFTVDVDSGTGRERLWREDRIQEVLSADDAEVLFIGGTSRNQVQFYPQFDHIVLLSAPADVLVQRLTTRTNNPYGKTSAELAETLGFLKTVEPQLRRRATLEIDTSAPVEHVITAILEHVLE